MLRSLFRPPQTDCPHCARHQVSWGSLSLVSPAAVAVFRLVSRLTKRLFSVRLRCKNCNQSFGYLYALPRTVIGYHGCHKDFAQRLVRGGVSAEEWKMSQNDYDWLGNGIYFWEHAPGRAKQWAEERYGTDGAVVATEVQLRRCLDLADTAFTSLLRQSFEGTIRLYQAEGWTLPKNGGREFKLRRLDRLVVDRLTTATDGPDGVHFQTVRCPFEEGDPVYDGGMIKTQSHIQIAVRDRDCIPGRVYQVNE